MIGIDRTGIKFNSAWIIGKPWLPGQGIEVLFHSEELLNSLKLSAAGGLAGDILQGELSRLNKNLIRKADIGVEVPKGRWKEKGISLPEKIEKVIIDQFSFLSPVPLRGVFELHLLSLLERYFSQIPQEC